MLIFHKWASERNEVFEKGVAGKNKDESLYSLILKSEILLLSKGLIQSIPKYLAIVIQFLD